MDVTTTLARLVGRSTDGFEGRDLRDPDRTVAVSQRGHAPLDAYERHDPTFSLEGVGSDPVTAVRATDHAYLTDGTDEWLYALPDETPAVLDRLRETCDRLPTERRAVGGNRPTFDEATRDRLRDLGYVTE